MFLLHFRHVTHVISLMLFQVLVQYIHTPGCLQLLEILEISWNLKTFLETLEISWNFLDLLEILV